MKIKYDNCFDDKLIRRLYYKKKMSAIEIAEYLKTKSQYIYRFMMFHNMKLRNKHQSLKNAYQNGRKKKLAAEQVQRRNMNITKREIEYLYKEKNLTLIDVAKSLDASIYTINRLVKKFNIPLNKKIAENNPNWKNGIRFERNRKIIYCPKHKNANKLGYIYEYRLIAEKKLGRPLKKKEIVHHIDGDVTNNNLKNLKVMTQSEHASLPRIKVMNN